MSPTAGASCILPPASFLSSSFGHLLPLDAHILNAHDKLSTTNLTHKLDKAYSVGCLLLRSPYRPPQRCLRPDLLSENTVTGNSAIPNTATSHTNPTRHLPHPSSARYHNISITHSAHVPGPTHRSSFYSPRATRCTRRYLFTCRHPQRAYLTARYTPHG